MNSKSGLLSLSRLLVNTFKEDLEEVMNWSNVFTQMWSTGSWKFKVNSWSQTKSDSLTIFGGLRAMTVRVFRLSTLILIYFHKNLLSGEFFAILSRKIKIFSCNCKMIKQSMFFNPQIIPY